MLQPNAILRLIARSLLAAAAMLSAMAASGCSWTIRQADGTNVQAVLNLDRDKYVIMETVKGHGRVKYFFGFIRISDGQYGYVRSQSIWDWKDAEAIATFQAINQAPGADTLLPLTTEVSGHGFPYVYWVEIADVSGKALRLKTDKELGK